MGKKFLLRTLSSSNQANGTLNWILGRILTRILGLIFKNSISGARDCYGCHSKTSYLEIYLNTVLGRPS